MNFAAAQAVINANTDLTRKECLAAHHALKVAHKNIISTLADDEVDFSEVTINVREEDYNGLLDKPIRHVNMFITGRGRLYNVMAGVRVGPRGGLKWTSANREINNLYTKTKFYA